MWLWALDINDIFNRGDDYIREGVKRELCDEYFFAVVKYFAYYEVDKVIANVNYSHTLENR